MVTLAAPVILGDLTRCSRSVDLQGLIHHANVEVVVDGNAVKLGQADWPEQRFDLPAGTALAPGAKVHTRQSSDATPGPLSAIEALVQDIAIPMPAPLIDSPLVGCAQLVVVSDLSPDARVEIVDTAGVSLGIANASGPRAVIHIGRELANGEVVEARADACGSLASAFSLGAEPIAKPGTSLDPPHFAGLIYECQRVIDFDGLRPGSSLFIERGDGSQVKLDVNAARVRARIDPPVSLGERLVAWAEAPKACEVKPSAKVDAVASSDPPPPVRVVAHPCPTSPAVEVAGLIPSAELIIAAGGATVLKVGASESTQLIDLSGHGVSVGDRLELTQELCPGRASSPTTMVVHVAQGAKSVEFPEALIECARIVHVAGGESGSLLTINSKKLGGRIGFGMATGGGIAIDVNPPLMLNDDVTVVSAGCFAGDASAAVKAGAFRLPEIVRAIEGETAVLVTGAIPGSVVDIRAGLNTIGSQVVAEEDASIALSRPLVADELLTVTIRWCDHVATGDAVRVARRRPVEFHLRTGKGVRNPHNKWNGGRVEGIVPLAGGAAIVATERAGIWHLEGNGAFTPLGLTWTSAAMRCIATDPTMPGRLFAGAEDGLHSTVQGVVPMELAWAQVPSAPSRGVNDVLVLPGHQLLLLATDTGLLQAPLPNFPAVAFTVPDPLVSAGRFDSLALGPNDSVIAYAPQQVFVGRWNGNSLAWTNRTFSTPPGGDARLSAIATTMSNGVLASAPSDRSRVYLATKNGGTSDNDWQPVVRSDDGGWTWLVPGNGDLSSLSVMGSTQGGRNLAIAVQPTNRDTVLIGGRRAGLLGSTNAGASWDTGKWAQTDDSDFHSDTLCVLFDTQDGTGNTVWAGGDGGIYRSTDLGVTWTDRNENFGTLMFDSFGAVPGLALGANDGSADLVVGGLQDNGLVWSLNEGTPWVQITHSDGRRTVFIDENEILLLTNVSGGIWWESWTGADMVKRAVLNPPNVAVGVNDPVLVRVDQPAFRRNGDLMVALLADQDDPARLYGLFDGKPGSSDADRYRWELLGTVPTNVLGLASFDGNVVIVCSNQAGAISISRFDPATATLDNCVMPASVGPGASVTRPIFLGPSSAVAIGPKDLLVTDDLIAWRSLPALPSTRTAGGATLAQPWTVAVDRATAPPTILAGTFDGVWTTIDFGKTWVPAKGLPATTLACQSQIAFAAGRRVCHVGTWNWSCWTAELQ